jgi:hypothetical protein
MASFRLFITVCKFRNTVPIHMDIRNAYLHASISENIFMRQPPGFVDPDFPNHVCKLKKALYGLHQAGHNWHALIDKDLQSFGLTRIEHDPCIYRTQTCENEWVILCLYVDDLLIAGDDTSVKKIIDFLKRKYSVSAEGKIQRYLGINVTTGEGPWRLDQSSDILGFIRDQQLEGLRKADRPGDPDLRYTDTLTGPAVNQTGFRSLIGRLLWYAIATRPDILYAVNVAAQFQQNPTTRAWTAAKRIARYLLATHDIGIEIAPIGTSFEDHADSNHGDPALNDRLSISGGAYYMGGSLVHWTSRKQRTPAHSTAESEIMAGSDVTREGLWLAHIAKEFGYAGPVTLKIDNSAAVDIANSPGLTRRVKHIELRDAYIRIMRERGVIIVSRIPTELNGADLLTKAFQSPAKFIHARTVTLKGPMRHEAAGECWNTSSSNPPDVH